MIYIREAVDRKQENMRRRKRKDALRLQLVKVFEKIAEHGTYGVRYALLINSRKVASDGTTSWKSFMVDTLRLAV